jgi:hypothetical protein
LEIPDLSQNLAASVEKLLTAADLGRQDVLINSLISATGCVNRLTEAWPE